MSYEVPPLTGDITLCGDPALPVERKFRPIASSDMLLAHMDVNEALVSDIARVAGLLLPLNALTLARPVEEGDSGIEGRGLYVPDVPVSEDTTAVVYVKGTGSSMSFGAEASPFPGYPPETKNLFFDSLTRRNRHPHPRMVGTETMAWGAMEFVNASVIFATLAREHGWQTVADAVRSGVTIPLNIVHFPELSEYLQKLIHRYRGEHEIRLYAPQSEPERRREVRALNWRGNRAVGTVSMIVPSDTRRARMQDGHYRCQPNGTDKTADSEDYARMSGELVRTLFDMGYCYSKGSAHGENAYDRGLLPQADNSDLIPLRAIQVEADHRHVTDRITGTVYHLTDDNAPPLLLFASLRNDNLLTPPIRAYDHMGTTIESIARAQQIFIDQLTSHALPRNRCAMLAELYPYMPDEVCMALARHVWKTSTTHSPSSQLQGRNASYAMEALKTFDEFFATTELKRKLENNVGNDLIHRFILAYEEHERWHHASIDRFMQSGRIADLIADPYVDAIRTLSQRLRSIPEDADVGAVGFTNTYPLRRTLYSGWMGVTRMREYTRWDRFGMRPQHYLEGKDVAYISDLIGEERYYDALTAMELVRCLDERAVNTFALTDVFTTYTTLLDLFEGGDAEELLWKSHCDLAIQNIMHACAISECLAEDEIRAILDTDADEYAKTRAYRAIMLCAQRAMQAVPEEHQHEQTKILQNIARINRDHYLRIDWGDSDIFEDPYEKHMVPETLFMIHLLAYRDLRGTRPEEAAQLYRFIARYVREVFPKRTQALGISNAELHTSIHQKATLAELWTYFNSLRARYERAGLRRASDLLTQLHASLFLSVS